MSKAINTSAINAAARNTLAALAAFDKVATKTTAQIRAAFQGAVDAHMVAGFDRAVPAEVQALGKAIREAEPFMNAVAAGSIEKKTVTEYAQSAMRAFFHNVPFEASLKNNPDMALPSGKAGSGNPAKDASIKAGATKSTDRAAVDATACKLLQQLRLLGLTDTAAEILDVLIERLDGFKEPAPAAM
jgi:hypothetical protein